MGCQLGLAILICTSPIECLVHTDSMARATISKYGHVSVIGGKLAPAPPPTDSSPDCSSFTSQNQSHDCAHNNCGFKWVMAAGQFSIICKSCASFTELAACTYLGCAWIGKTCQAVNLIVFGGAVHSSDGFLRMRPENLLSERCRSSERCDPCIRTDDCWHGTGQYYMTVDLPAGSSGSRRATLWSRCLKQASRWLTELTGPMSNGILKVKLDGVLQKTWTKKQWWVNKLNSVVGQGDHNMEFSFEAQESSKDAKVTIRSEIYDAQTWVDTCMSRKLCLDKLGDGTHKSFALRNNKKQQLRCLQAKTKKKRRKIAGGQCEVWVGCMGHTDRKTLKAILRVVVPSRRRKATASTSLVDQASGCINPSTYDPEAAECECFFDIQESCAGKSDEEVCILEKVCANSNVCKSWKKEKCTASFGDATANVEGTGSLLIQRTQAAVTALGNIENTLKGTASLLIQRSENDENSTTKVNMPDTLQDTLKGKCSSESQ